MENNAQKLNKSGKCTLNLTEQIIVQKRKKIFKKSSNQNKQSRCKTKYQDNTLYANESKYSKNKDNMTFKYTNK